MKLSRVLLSLILPAVCYAASLPAAAQAVSPAATWSCTFPSSPTGCGMLLQAAASNRASLISDALEGTNAVELTTQPGDDNLYGSGTAERADLSLPPSSTYCNQGQEEWWANSIMFPNGYVVPPAGATWNWGVVFDFHNSGLTGQPNFQIVSLPTGLEFWVAGGPTVVNGPSDPGFYSAPIGTVTKNMWYDFVYHIKWSTGSDGFIQAWLNGQLLMNYSGPTLYVGQTCYLKLANYHTAIGVPVSVIHARIVMGNSQAAVQIGSSGTTTASAAPATAVYDFDGAGRSDVAWRDASTGQDMLWLMNGQTVASQPALATVSDLNWQIVGAGNFNGDGRSDILWRNTSTGENQIWFMNGATIATAANLATVPAPDWVVAGIGDFNGDGTADILWHNTSTGENQIWFMNGATLTSAATIASAPSTSWSVAGVGDFDDNGTADILWHNASTGQSQIWLMNGATVTSETALPAVSDPNWRIVGVGDFNGDGKADILWRNASTGDDEIYFMNGATVASTADIETISNLDWSVVSVGDYFGTGTSDILWRNSSTGQNEVFVMSGGAVASTASLPSMSSSAWNVVLH